MNPEKANSYPTQTTTENRVTHNPHSMKILWRKKIKVCVGGGGREELLL